MAQKTLVTLMCLKKLISCKIVEGIKNLTLSKVEFCESCINGKLTRLPFKTRKRSNNLLEIVYSDICGPITSVSYDNSRYFVTFIDDYSNFVCIYTIKKKSEVFNCYKELTDGTNKFNKKISTLRCDNGKEYCFREHK